MTADPWEVRRVASGLALELHGGDVLAFLLAHGDPAIRVDRATLGG